MACAAPVALAIGCAGRLAFVDTGAVRIGGVGGNAQTSSLGPRNAAASASASARILTAETIDTLEGVALAVVGARLSVRLWTTPACGYASCNDGLASVRVGAVFVAGARAVACTAYTKVRRTLRQACLAAGAKPVTGSRGVELRTGRADRVPARRVFGVEGARPEAVAKASIATGGFVAGIARRVGQSWVDKRAAPERARLTASHASASAGHVATVPIRAVPAGALVVARGAEIAIEFLAATLVQAFLPSGAQ